MATRDLASLLASVGRLEPAYAAFIVIRCCHKLERVDQRPLSPSRIRLSSDGDVTIADFDLEARDFGYLAPEVASGRPQVVVLEDPLLRGATHAGPRFLPDATWTTFEPRAAVFTLGSILWEMLAGRPLFKGATDYRTIELVRAAAVPALADVTAELDAIVRRALARDVAARYQTPGELAAALAEHLKPGAPS